MLPFDDPISSHKLAAVYVCFLLSGALVLGMLHQNHIYSIW